MKREHLDCANCGVNACWSGEKDRYPDFCITKNSDPEMLKECLAEYTENEENSRMFITAAINEAEFYGRLTRVEETIEFIKRMGYKKIGIATCYGLLPETRIFSRILTGCGIEHHVVCCKVGGCDKTEAGVPNEKKLNGGTGHESMCNPIMQARELARWGADFNIVIGLCVGHDTLFLKYTDTPTTVMIVKDRVLGHNPAAALYSADTIYSRFKKELQK